ncbi:MAG: hypothetical protein QOG04_682 [Actinomycetota bacterium]|jgi:hypothetical protein|nr:hypothetical protein [Actinomycetota bacterium]
MDNDFQGHLDTARLWWDLDDGVLRAIAEGRSTREPFRAIALYVLDLKARASVEDPADNTAALTKIAIRVAGTPEWLAAPPLGAKRAIRMSRTRLAAIVALVLVSLLALVTAAAAANVITLPMPVEDLFRKVGIPLPQDTTESSKQRPGGFAAPLPAGETGSLIGPGSTVEGDTGGDSEPTRDPSPSDDSLSNEPRTDRSGTTSDANGSKGDGSANAYAYGRGYGSRTDRTEDAKKNEVGGEKQPAPKPTPRQRPRPRPRPSPSRRGGGDPDDGG